MGARLFGSTYLMCVCICIPIPEDDFVLSSIHLVESGS